MNVDRDQAEEWSGWFRALGDPNRILLLNILATEEEPVTVGELVDRLEVGQSTVSHHLAKLLEAGFVFVERIGTSSRWEINQRCLDRFPTAASLTFGGIPAESTDPLEKAI